LKTNNDPRFDQVAKQTGIYLQNPHWLEFQLSKLRQGQTTETAEEDVLVEKTENEGAEELSEPFEESILLNEENENDPAVNEIQGELDSPVVEEHKEGGTPFAVNEQTSENLPSQVEVPEAVNEELLNEPQAEVADREQNEIIEQPVQEELPVPVNEQNNQNLPVETASSEDENAELTERKSTDAVLNNEFVEVPIVEEAKEEIIAEGTTPEPQLEPGQNENVDENANNEEAVLVENVASGEATPGEEETEFSVPFEPLHTVDYFASQGIQLSEDALNNDQLGKQVKSFTAWLKSMKKLHPGQLPEQNEVIEKLIQTSSEASNQNANVLTEAMAEVLVKQGKREKAIEMYQKLSLINPSKSAYFAAKIENLKII
jgi:hypothetical protein